MMLIMKTPNQLLLLPLLYFLVAIPVSRSIVLTEDGRCRVLGFFPTEIANDEVSSSQRRPHSSYARWTREEVRRVSRSMMAAAQMALEHFHARDTSVVPELADLPRECTVQLQLEVFTEHLTAKRAGQIMVHQAADNACAVLGTYDPDVARTMQPTSVALDLPQVMYYTLDQFLTSSKRPSAVGLPPTVLPHTRALAEYLNAGQVVPPRRYLQIVYEEAYTSSYLTRCFQEDAADKYGLMTDQYQDDHLGIIPTKTPEQIQREALQKVHSSGVKTIFLNKIDAAGLNLTAHILADLDMLTDEYLYVFTPQAVPTDAVGILFGGQLKDSPLDLLLRGGLILDHHDPFRANPAADSFLKAWRSQGPDMIQRITEAQWSDFVTTTDANFFQDGLPADYAAFLYDAVMAIGMGACYATTEKPANDTTTPFRDDIRAYEFHGATGHVHWDCPYKSNRCNDPLKFGIFNIQAVPVRGDDTLHTYTTLLTAEWDIEGRWQKRADFVYRDGTTNHPTNLREAWEHNYLSKGVFWFGMFLFLSAATLSIMGLTAVIKMRQVQLVTQSQPFFLGLFCVGSFFMSCSIFTLSLDESSFGGSIENKSLDVACQLSVWMFFGGHVLSFAALVCKTRRVHKVTFFRKGTRISRSRAVIPLILIMAVTFALLGAWAANDPWKWKREMVTLNPYETYGHCQSDNFWAFFGPLVGVVTATEFLSLYFLYKTQEVDENYSNTTNTVYTIYTQVQAWFFGIPMLTVLENGDSADAIYLSRALLIWVFSVSGVIFCVGRRIYSSIQEGKERPSSNLHISGVHFSPNASDKYLCSKTLTSGGNQSTPKALDIQDEDESDINCKLRKSASNPSGCNQSPSRALDVLEEEGCDEKVNSLSDEPAPMLDGD